MQGFTYAKECDLKQHEHRDLLEAWLGCEDCSREALEQILADHDIEPCLEAVLRGEEIVPANEDEYISELRKSYDAVAEHYLGKAPGGVAATSGMSWEEYKEQELQARRALRRVRAVDALRLYDKEEILEVLRREHETLSGRVPTSASDVIVRDRIDEIIKSGK
jgi:hypothetical protein